MKEKPKEFRFRIKEPDLPILREALASLLKKEIDTFVKQHEDKIFEMERAHWRKRYEIEDEIKDQSPKKIDKIARAYLLLYRLVHTETGRPWESRFNPTERCYRNKAIELISEAGGSPRNGPVSREPEK